MGFLPRRGVPAGLVQPGTVAGQILVWNGTAWVPTIHYVDSYQLAADVLVDNLAWWTLATLNVNIASAAILDAFVSATGAFTLVSWCRFQILLDGVMFGQRACGTDSVAAGVFAMSAQTPIGAGAHTIDFKAQTDANVYRVRAATQSAYEGASMNILIRGT